MMITVGDGRIVKCANGITRVPFVAWTPEKLEPSAEQEPSAGGSMPMPCEVSALLDGLAGLPCIRDYLDPREDDDEWLDDVWEPRFGGDGSWEAFTWLGESREYRAALGLLDALTSRILAHHARAERLGLESTLTVDEWRLTLRAFDSRCVYCGRTDRLAIEHVRPLSLGGSNSADNVAPACQRCNSTKGARSLEAFCEAASIDVESVRARLDLGWAMARTRSAS